MKRTMDSPAPFNVGSDTSEDAAKSLSRKTLHTLRDLVLAKISHYGFAGLTCDEAEQRLGLSHQTCSARFNELRGLKLIVDSGQRRKTRSGRAAAVYVQNLKGDE